MNYIDDFRDPGLAHTLARRIGRRSTMPLHIMEFCGGHTHAMMRYGVRQLLPETIRLSSGPGCPVCVTDDTDLDRAIALSQLPRVILTTFGDMVRVPGSQRNGAVPSSLQEAASEGADVRVVYSTLDALQTALGCTSISHRDHFLRLAYVVQTRASQGSPTMMSAIIRAAGKRRAGAQDGIQGSFR